MFTTRTRSQRPEPQGLPATQGRPAPATHSPLRSSAQLDLEEDLPWLGPAPHWVSDLDGSRLRMSLQTRGFTLVEVGHHGVTTEEALLSELQVAFGLPAEARTG